MNLFPERFLKKFVFYGDVFLGSPHGYAETLIDLLVMRRPDAGFTAFFPGEENLLLQSGERDLPLLIGKAPDFVYLGLGSADILRGTEPEEAFAALDSLVETLLQKTRARIAVANLCEAFFPSDARGAAAEFNFALPRLAGGPGEPRVRIVDLNAPVNVFFDQHRRGSGEKRSLIEGSPARLTSMGRVFLSHAAFGQLALEDYFQT